MTDLHAFFQLLGGSECDLLAGLDLDRLAGSWVPPHSGWQRSHLQDAETDVLAYMDFPILHLTKLHSTNPTERLNGEVKRRTDVVGSFPNEDAITRLVGVVLLEQDDEWSVQRAGYVTLETITPRSNTDLVSLSAVLV